jgi:hypothetical protein
MEYIILALVGFNIVQYLVNQRRVNELLDRIMSKHYEEFKYYKEKYPDDLKELKKLRKDTRKEAMKESEIEFHDPDTLKRISRFEEDWGAEEVDARQLEAMERSDMEMTSNDVDKDN